MKALSKIFKRFFILLINIYKSLISPFLGSNCRYQPTCSKYALDAFDQLSFFRAFYLSLKRVGSCHPFSKGGLDPINK